MAELEDLTIKQTDKGHIEACGKIRKGEDILTGCVVFSIMDGKPVALEGSGHPEVQDKIRENLSKRITIR